MSYIPTPPGYTSIGVASGPFSAYPPPVPSAMSRLAGMGPVVTADLPYAAAGGATGGGGFLSNAFATNVGPKLLGGTGEVGLARLAVPFGAGQIGAYGINKVLPSTGQAGNVREVLADAAVGAGIGGTVGSIFPGIGTALGAGVGGAAGGLYGLAQNLFGGDEAAGASDDDLRKTLEASAKTLGLGPAQYTTAFDMAVKTGMKDAQGNKLTNQDIAATLAGQMQNDVIANRQSAEQTGMAQVQHEADLKYALAAQTQARDYLAPYAAQIMTGAQSQHDTLMGLAAKTAPEYRPVFEAQAQQALASGQQISGAYMAQAQLMPTMQVLNTYDQRRQQEMADVARIYQAAAQMKSQSPAGGVDFSTLGASPVNLAQPSG